MSYCERCSEELTLRHYCFCNNCFKGEKKYSDKKWRKKISFLFDEAQKWDGLTRKEKEMLLRFKRELLK